MAALHLHPEDTIAALASPPGPAPRGIVRLSGPRAAELAERVWSPAHPAEFPTSNCKLAAIYPGAVHLPPLPQAVPALLHLWPGRRSYTGEPVAELHLAGAPPLLEGVLAQLFAAGARPAQPGEFTLRAFLAGRLDLTQAEAVLGVIDAADQQELHRALAQLAGGISSAIGRLRSDLLDLLADLEAGLDFTEEDLDFVPQAELIRRVAAARDSVRQLKDQSAGRMWNSTQPRVVLAGPPNAGKSTLFNALVGRAAALISETRGTTRDYLAADVAADGFRFTLVDTAGLDADCGGIDALAQLQRDEQLHSADLILWCLPADASPEDAACRPGLPTDRYRGTSVLYLQTKSDLIAQPSPLAAHTADTPLPVSAARGTHLPQLVAEIRRHFAHSAGHRQLVGTTAARCHDSLRGAAAALERARQLAEGHADQELLAIELRETLDELGKIVGAVYTDDILDRIFSRFCIGK